MSHDTRRFLPIAVAPGCSSPATDLAMSLSSDIAAENQVDVIREELAEELQGEQTSPMRFDPQREHFIPLAKNDLIRLLRERLNESPADADRFVSLCRLLEAIFHFESHACLRELKENYAPLDPDTAVVELQTITEEERDQRSEAFIERIGRLLNQANYRELDHTEIDEAVNAATALGVRLRVDFDLFQRLLVFVRGDMIDTRTIRNALTWFRKKTVEVPVYQRLVVVFRLQDADPKVHHVCDDHVYLKVFKNIPKTDLDMLLPGSKVRMTLLDQGRILVPTLSGIAVSLVKLFKAFALATLFAGFYGFLVFLGLLGGTIGYGVKSFFGYLRTKDKYQLSVTKHLYYQNLDNNAGVIFRILNEAEEQEFREAIVAYYLLWQESGNEGFGKEELDQRAEAFLKELIQVDVDFEDEDALNKLARLGLAQQHADGRWRHTPLDEALSRLDEAWDNYFQFHAASDPPAPQRCAEFETTNGDSTDPTDVG